MGVWVAFWVHLIIACLFLAALVVTNSQWAEDTRTTRDAVIGNVLGITFLVLMSIRASEFFDKGMAQ
jgi:hypothetical protein